MKFDLNGKVIVITGASSGIGAQLAYDVAKKGAIPILLARSESALKDMTEKISTSGKPAYYYVLDVQSDERVQAVFTEIYAKFSKVDILVNNAGFGLFEEFIASDLKNIRAMFDVNVFGLMACTKAVLEKMMQQDNGHIINIASQAGKLGTPKSTGYSATKHAVLGFTNALRLELMDHNIYVSSVNPGPIKTKFFDIADQSGQYVKNVQAYMLTPEFVSKKIVQLMESPKRELNLPLWMGLGSTFYQVFPSLVEKIGGRAFKMK